MAKWMGSKPEQCDLCQYKMGEFFIEGKTIQGPWGLLCEQCHDEYGIGLGTGRGQKYNTDTLEKVGADI